MTRWWFSWAWSPKGSKQSDKERTECKEKKEMVKSKSEKKWKELNGGSISVTRLAAPNEHVISGKKIFFIRIIGRNSGAGILRYHCILECIKWEMIFLIEIEIEMIYWYLPGW